MWQLNFILIVFFIAKTNGRTSFSTSNSTEFNRTYTLFISEDVPIGHTQIIDTFDLSFCSMYTTFSRHLNLPFEILLMSNENCTLNFYVIHLLDREQISSYTFQQEFLHENSSIIIQLRIIILDVNDHVPQFPNEHFYFIVKETIQPGTMIGRVQAYDPDLLLNGKIFYTLSGVDLIDLDNRTIFRIDGTTGDIFLFDYILDYETKREYNLIVEAKDYGDNGTSVSSFANITINVEDINDEKPQIIFTMPNEDLDKESVRIMNISKPNLNEEQNRLIKSFRSNINLIEHDAEMIYLTKEEPLPANSLLALLHLRDNDQISSEHLTLDIQTYVQCSIQESFLNNRTFCNQSNLFHLSLFRSNVYALLTSRILDREEYETYIIHLTANDNDNQSIENHSLHSELFIYLSLLDINDNIPIFEQTYFHIKIDENQAEQTILTRLHAYDIDKGRNGTVRYEFIVKKRQVFSLGKYSGILRTKYKLDREQCEWYRIGIRAYDLGYPKRKYSSMVIVDVEINNINDHIPYFMHDVYHFDIEENAPIGKIVGRITIGDRDEQEPIEQMINLSSSDDGDIVRLNSMTSNKISRINYSLVDFLFVDSYLNESSSGLFSIDSQGFIHTLVILDRELQSNYTLYILMYDPILKSYALPTRVIIQILDENDNIPFELFLSNSSILLIEQINNDVTIIYEFKPIDLDDGLNGLVSIECLDCTSSFYFHMVNSSILITRSNIIVPDGMYTLTFILRDHGLVKSHQQFYTLTFNLTHRLNLTEQEKLFALNSIYENYFSGSWHYLILFIFSLLVLVFILSWVCYYYNQRTVKKQIHQEETRILTPIYHIIPDHRNFSNNNLSNNLNPIAVRDYPTKLAFRSISFSQLHNTYQLSSSMMNSRETILTDAATNTSYHEDKNDYWQLMNNHNNNRILFENPSNTILQNKNYHFEPIDRDFSLTPSSSQSNNSSIIQRPIPISNTQQQYVSQTKRNSSMNINSSNIDSTIRSYILPRSMTSDQLANNNNNNNNNNNTTTRLYYYPSVQDVLDALNRRAFDKESFV